MTTEELENYEPKGNLIDFPKEIIARMLNYQEEQWNKIDVSVFERDKTAGETAKGIFWSQTKEGFEFWNEVIRYQNFYVFFAMYPKQDNQESKTAKYVQVGNNTILSDYTSTQSSVEIEINTTEDNSQEFRVGDNVIDIITRQIGFVKNINLKEVTIFQLAVVFEDCRTKFYSLEGKYYYDSKIPILLHYRDDYDYDVIDFNNLPKRQEPNRWRAKKDGVYNFVSFYNGCCFFSDVNKDEYNSFDNDKYNSGNYFRTEVEAEIIAQKLNTYFKELIKEEHEHERN